MFKTHTCISLHCDGCGEAVDNDGGIAHYETNDQRRAFEEAEACDWHVLRDGRVYCTATKCEAQLPACVCESGDCDYRCTPGCPCVLHQEVRCWAPTPTAAASVASGMPRVTRVWSSREGGGCEPAHP